MKTFCEAAKENSGNYDVLMGICNLEVPEFFISIKYVIFLTIKKYENEIEKNLLLSTGMWEIVLGFQSCLVFYSSIKTEVVFYKLKNKTLQEK